MIISDIWRYIIIQVIIEPTSAGVPGTFVLSFEMIACNICRTWKD